MITLEPFPPSDIDKIIAYLKRYKKELRAPRGRFYVISFNISPQALNKLDKDRERLYRSIYIENLIAKTDELPINPSPYKKTKTTSITITPLALEKLGQLEDQDNTTRSETIERLILHAK